MKWSPEVGFNGYHLIKKGYTRFFGELLYYNSSERYPSYKHKVASFLSKEKAGAILDETKEVFIWLESLSQYKMR